MPVSGEVEINEELNDSPESVNNNPYESGWMIRVRPPTLAGSGLLSPPHTQVKSVTDLGKLILKFLSKTACGPAKLVPKAYYIYPFHLINFPNEPYGVVFLCLFGFLIIRSKVTQSVIVASMGEVALST